MTSVRIIGLRKESRCDIGVLTTRSCLVSILFHFRPGSHAGSGGWHSLLQMFPGSVLTQTVEFASLSVRPL
jgi:hypothetical protein